MISLLIVISYNIMISHGGLIVIEFFKKGVKNPVRVEKKKEKQEERRQKAQSRGQKPIK